MCGLAGTLGPAARPSLSVETIVRGMTAVLRYRGPDATGTWVDEDMGVALGHTRLAVLELSAAGAQPMASASRRYRLVFNGEIYNHSSIRNELQLADASLRWRGHSDTETLLAGFDMWGIPVTLRNAVGMFALALWDCRDRVLTLARDRIGEKPVYYCWQGNVFLFGSELKALRAHPGFRGDVDRNAVAQYMRRGYVCAPQTIYRDVFKLMPGSYLQVRVPPAAVAEPQPYWSLRDTVQTGQAHPFVGSDQQAIDELDFQLRRSVALQSVADVPVGAFLSGGIDSSVVVALMQSQTSRRVKTFTIGFHERSHDEARYAESVARHLGTEHTELYVTPSEAMAVIPRLAQCYDEPFGDSSAIPTILVSELARRYVTVSLSGDGGDELFGGYTRYKRTNQVWSLLRHFPETLRFAASRAAAALGNRLSPSLTTWKISRLALYLEARDAEDCYRANVLQWRDSDEILVCARESAWAAPLLDPSLAHTNLYNSMMYADLQAYLPDDILVKLDRASMSVSLEARVPMLDHRLIEFAWSLPLHMKVRNRQGKWLLRQVLAKYLPEPLISRPKMGFGVPVSDWLRGPLRDWAEDLLSESRLMSDGYLVPSLVRAQWLRHLDGASVEGDSVWRTLMFQAWLSAGRAATAPAGG